MTDTITKQRGTNMRLFLAILMTIAPIMGHAQMRTNNKVAAFNRTEGVAAYENYASNQSFDENTNGVTAISGAAPAITTSIPLIGKGSLILSGTANTDQWRIRSKVFPTVTNTSAQQGAGLNGQNCQAKFIYSSAYGGPVTTSEFTGYVANSAGTNISGTTTLTGTYDISNPQQGRTALLFFPCPYNATAGNAYVDIIVSHVTGNTSSIVIDEMFNTYATDVGGGVPNNTFSAKFSATGVISDSNQTGWAGSAVVTDTSLFTIPLTGFTVAPNCTATINVNDNTSNITLKVESISATSVAIRTGFSSTSSSFTKLAEPFILNCAKAGIDFVQPTITPNLYNFTNEFSAQVSSAGVVSAENFDFINGNASVSDTSLYAITWTSNLFTAAPACVVTAGTNTVGAIGAIEVASTTSGISIRTSAGSTKTAYAFTIKCGRTGTDYRPTANVPILIGSVTSNSPNSIRIEFATLDTTAAGATCTTSKLSTPGWLSCTRPGVGGCSCTVATPFASAMSCDVGIAEVSSEVCRNNGGETASTFSTQCITIAASPVNAEAVLNVTCKGPR